MNEYAAELMKVGKSYLNIYLTDSCTWRCRGCFFGLALKDHSTKWKYDPQKLDQDIAYLAKIGADLAEIVLLGGEPSCDEFITAARIVRKYFKDSKLTILTSGIKLGFASIDKLKAFTELQPLAISFSQYPSLKDMRQKLITQLDSLGIPHNYHTDDHSPIVRDRFYKPITYDYPKYDKDANHAKCTCNCMQLQEGKLYPCGLALSVNARNKNFGTHYKEEFVDLYSLKSNDDLLNLIKNFSIDLCKYCTSGNHEYEWIPHQVKAKIDEADYIRKEKKIKVK